MILCHLNFIQNTQQSLILILKYIQTNRSLKYEPHKVDKILITYLLS